MGSPDPVATPITAVATVASTALLAVAVTLDTWVTASRGEGWVLELVVGVVVCVLATLRVREPVRVAAVGVVVCGAAAIVADVARLPSQPGVAATLGMFVLGAAAIRVATPRAGVLLTLAGVVVLVVGRVTLRGPAIAPAALAGVLAWGVALGLGAWLRMLDDRRRRAVESARREERLHLARELHDVAAHHIAGIVIQAQAAQVVAGSRPEMVSGLVAEIESAGAEALAAVRRVLGLLRESGDAWSASRPEALLVLVEQFSARHGAHVHQQLGDLPGASASWRPEVVTTVHRIVQEALTNVVRHAPAAPNVTITVQDGPTGLVVEVADDGPRGAPAGLPPDGSRGTSGGHGLVGMRERVHALGGTLLAGPGPHGGWTVHAVLPPATEERSWVSVS